MPATEVVSPVPWNDVNFLIVTDVHSWIAGHRHPDHTPALDADYGHVLSLHERLAEVAAARGCDLFLVQNGDLNDGTGFSRTPPAVLVPLLQSMPFDALTTGNHELYENENIDYLAKPGGFIDSWNGSFITSNTLDAATGEHLGSSHKLLVGRTSGVRVLAFGFLYDMIDHADHVIVTGVEEAVQQAWFVDALTATEYDAVLFLTHMDFKDPLVDLLLAATRASAGAAVPVLFVTGHSHVRAYRDLDTRAASFEAGRYLDTIGFASFSLSPPPSVASSSAAAAATIFSHLNIDANRASMAAAAGLADPSSLLTAAGAALRGDIKRAASGLRLSHVLGCAPRTYKAAAGLGAAESLWRLYLGEVTPRTAFGGNASRIAVQSTGSLRYDLYAGSVTLDDVWTMNPFADHSWRVAPAVSGGDVRAVLSALHAQAPSATDPRTSSDRTSGPLPRYAATSMPVGDEKYELWTVDYDLPAVVRAYELQTGSAPHPVRMLDGSTSTDLWMRYVQQAWPCNGTAAGEDLTGAGIGEQRPNLPALLLPLLAVFSLALLLALFRFRGCFRRLCARSTTPIRDVQQLVESTTAPGGVAMTAKAVTKS